MLLLTLAAAVQTPPPVVAARAVPAASAPLDDGTGRIVDLHVAGAFAELALRDRDGQQWREPLTTVELALSLLADNRMRPLWQPLLDWAGPGLERLRDRRVAAARAVTADGRTEIATSTAASSTRPKVRAAMLLAEELAGAGQLDQAIALIERTRGTAPGRGDWAQAEWMALSLRLRSYVRYRDGPAAARAVLDASEAALGSANDYSINFQINRAADLAEDGRHSEALAVLDAAEARYRGARDGRYGAGGERVPGSDRQFAWIRICALTGLGRGKEVASLVPTIYPPAEPSDDAFRIPASNSIRYRLFRCMDSATGVADEMAAELRDGSIGGTAFVQLQPGLYDVRKPPEFRLRVAADAKLAPLLAARFRVLPPALHPALNRWRAPPAATR